MKVHLEKQDFDELIKSLINDTKLYKLSIISYPILFLGFSNIYKEFEPILENKIFCSIITIVIAIIVIVLCIVGKKNSAKSLLTIVKYVQMDDYDYDLDINESYIKFVYEMGNYEIIKYENITFKSIKKDYIFLGTTLSTKIIPLRYFSADEKSYLIKFIKAC